LEAATFRAALPSCPASAVQYPAAARTSPCKVERPDDDDVARHVTFDATVNVPSHVSACPWLRRALAIRSQLVFYDFDHNSSFA